MSVKTVLLILTLSGACLVENRVLGRIYAKVFMELCIRARTHTQLSSDTLTETVSDKPCLASRYTLCSAFPETHWKTDQTMTHMSPLSTAFGWERHHWRILIEIPVVDEWCPTLPRLLFSVMHYLVWLPRAHICWGDTWDSVVNTCCSLRYREKRNCFSGVSLKRP